MRLFIALLVFSTFTSIGWAQNSNFTDGELEQMSESLKGGNIISSQSRNVKGDPYLNPDFTKGKIIINQNAETNSISLRFNIEKNVVEFIRDQQYYGIDPKKIDGFTLFGKPKNIVFKNGFESKGNDISRSTLLRVLYEGNTKLLAHHTTSLKKDIAVYGSATKKDEYVDNTKYYIVKASGDFTKINLDWNDFLDTLEVDNENIYLQFAKNKGLNFENESDFAMVLKYYDQLNTDS